MAAGDVVRVVTRGEALKLQTSGEASFGWTSGSSAFSEDRNDVVIIKNREAPAQELVPDVQRDSDGEDWDDLDEDLHA